MRTTRATGVGISSVHQDAMLFCVLRCSRLLQQPFVATLLILLSFTPKLLLWSLPFLGIGIALSMITQLTNLARILSLSAVTGSWILYAVLNQNWVQEKHPMLIDIILSCLPQHYGTNLWGPSWDWLTSGVILLSMSIVYSLVGYPLFARRNL